MRLRKFHGLGNDYLVLETARPVSERLVVRTCDRHTGVGGDGILQPLAIRRDDDGKPVSTYALRIWNPDGSKAEKSGNGLRIFARWLHRYRAAPAEFTVEVRLHDDPSTAEPGELVRCRVGPDEIEVAMGPARFEAAAVPCTRPLLDSPVDVDGDSLRLTAVGTGNPHCVVFLDQPGQLRTAPWRRWGAALETHPLFPNRTNVQFVLPIPSAPDDPPGSTRIAARIWERGAGETLASGSSSCAIAAAAVRLGRASREVIVAMPGGQLSVHVAADWQLTLRGPVEEIGVVELAQEWLQARGL